MSPTPAAEYARAATVWTDLDWWLLEARAVARHPDLTFALAFFAPPKAWKALARSEPTTNGRLGRKAKGWLMVPAHIATLVLPLLAAREMITWLFQSVPTAPVGRAGIFAGLAGAWLLFGMSRAARTPDGRTGDGALALGLLHVVPSAVATPIAFLAISQGEADGAIGVVGLVGDLAVGIAALRFYRAPGGAAATTGRVNLRRLHRAVEALDPHERLEILADLRRAIAVLEQRTLITADTARTARELPLAALARTLAPRETFTVPDPRANR
ncbi:hypothetical protein [Oerskovia flava]|uniref:hypothetical protein n=1 Tax=Oerskovia flava TaxID=2986422 RepID=UPI00223F90F8|nr:hypothetical protein [Oerskovia sp. JB1-3-2]